MPSGRNFCVPLPNSNRKRGSSARKKTPDGWCRSDMQERRDRRGPGHHAGEPDKMRRQIIHRRWPAHLVGDYGERVQGPGEREHLANEAPCIIAEQLAHSGMARSIELRRSRYGIAYAGLALAAIGQRVMSLPGFNCLGNKV